MSISLGVRLCIWFFLVIATAVVVRGQVETPNAIIKISGQTTLNCYSTTNDLPISYWRRSTDGTTYLTISVGCNPVTGNDPAYYRTELIAGTNCRLTIANVTMQQAGVYECYGGSVGTGYRSLITVIDHIASIVVYNRSEVVDGDQLNISCSINYNGAASPAPSLRPSPYWTTSPGQIFTSATYHPSTNVVAVITTVTVQKYTVPIFQCGTVFEITGNTNGYNPTPPSDDFTVGNTQKIDVQYPVETISISSSVPKEDSCVSKTETLTCTANANPPAQYMWHDLKDNTNTTGAVLSISSGGEYQCIAYNYIRNQMHSNTGTVTETNCHSPYNLTINGTYCVDNVCTCNGNASYAEEISITCMANGIPVPTVEWRSDNQFDGLYETIEATYDGNYTCTASNTYGGKDYNAELTVVVYDCLDPASISPTTSTMANTNATTGSTSNNVAAIVMGVLFGISLVVNIILLIMLIRKKDTTKSKENIPEPQIPHHSDPFPPTAYEELRRNDGINLQPTTYEQLTHRPPLYVNHVS